jgi:hypothetical protein
VWGNTGAAAYYELSKNPGSQIHKKRDAKTSELTSSRITPRDDASGQVDLIEPTQRPAPAASLRHGEGENWSVAVAHSQASPDIREDRHRNQGDADLDGEL